MEHGMAVTRTVSVGAIGSGARIGGKPDVYDFSTERRHSSAGLRALLWATGSARSLGSFSGSESHSSKDNIYTNILTPGSVPRFTIPSLSVQPVCQRAEDGGGTPGEGGEGEMDEGLGLESTMCSLSVSPSSLSSCSPSCPYPGRPAHRSVSDPLAVGRRAVRRESSVPYLEDRHCPDAASRAALSLPHLEKVTTPYGFVTLSRSPQMASEEALLCLRRPQAWEESQDRPLGPGPTPRPVPPAATSSSSTSCALANPRPTLTSTSHTPANLRPTLTSTSRLPANPSPTSRRTSHTPHLSKDTTSSFAAEVPKKKTLSRSAATAWSLPSPSSEGKPTRRLWGVLRKHLTSQ